jgi:hypothetical protein
LYQNRLHQYRPARVRTGFFCAVLAIMLLLLLSNGSAVTSANAAASDENLLRITKTTIYGALLGGLLGLASTLIVEEDHRDDAVRWGVALGTFGGFAYGVATLKDTNDFDDFSLRRFESRLRDVDARASNIEGSARLGALGCLGLEHAHVHERHHYLPGIEVSNDSLEEEDRGEEAGPGE